MSENYITKKVFVRAIEAYMADGLSHRKIEKTLDNFCDGFPCIQDNSSQNFILDFVEDVLEDKTHIISDWIYDQIEKRIYINGETYYLDTIEDLYDYFTIVRHPEDDSADAIAKKIKALKLSDFPKNEKDIYMYICENVDETIKKIKKVGKSNKIKNLVVELKLLKEDIEKSKELK